MGRSVDGVEIPDGTSGLALAAQLLADDQVVGTEALGDDITHKFTRPYRPQTNGKVERFNRTLAQEWAYAHTYLSDEARAATYQQWVHDYNHHRPHTGIGGKSPIERVHNVPGTNN